MSPSPLHAHGQLAPTPKNQFFGSNPPPGTWVRFHSDAFIEPGNIILTGMLGVVVTHPYAACICTPGISTMVKVVGTEEPFGHFNESFVQLGSEPAEREILESFALWDGAFDIFEDKHGYTGFARMGKDIVRQERLFRELRELSSKISKWDGHPIKEADIKGSLQRIRKILKAFAKHPNGDRAQKLAEATTALSSGTQNIPALLEDVVKWVEEVESIPRIRTLSG
jgi:hypothetical protein